MTSAMKSILVLCLLASFARIRVNGQSVRTVGERTVFANIGIWDIVQSVLYYPDTTTGIVYRYDPATDSSTTMFIGTGISVFLPVKGRTDLFVVVANLTVEAVGWDGQSSTPSSRRVLFSVNNDRTGYRFDDAKTDVNGVLFAGTIGRLSEDSAGREIYEKNLASLYRYRDSDDVCSVYVLLTPVSTADGMSWSPDNTIMYVIDFEDRTIYEFDYILDETRLFNKRVFFNSTARGYTDTADYSVFPVSIAVDEQGNLWVPMNGLGILLQISPDGREIRRVSIPTLAPSSAAWGGDTLYITTSQDLGDNSPEAGYTLAVTDLGVSGLKCATPPVDICSSIATVNP